jgi:hypothetical protein
MTKAPRAILDEIALVASNSEGKLPPLLCGGLGLSGGLLGGYPHTVDSGFVVPGTT